MFVSFCFPMKTLQREREIIVYLPDDYYQKNNNYPVLYIQDGQNAFFDYSSYSGISWGFLEYVKETKLDIILVAIPCNEEGFKRMDEYGPWPINEALSYQETQQKGLIIGGEGKAYVNWLKDELKPYIDRRFRTQKDNTGIVGSSMGAVISAYAALQYPEVFRKCAALSTAFWFYVDEFIDIIGHHDYDENYRIYLDLGEFESGDDEVINQWYIESNQTIYEYLEPKVKHLEVHYFPGAQHNEAQWRERVPLFMSFLYKEDEACIE